MVEGEWRTISTSGNLPTLNSSNKIIIISIKTFTYKIYPVSLKQGPLFLISLEIYCETLQYNKDDIPRRFLCRYYKHCTGFTRYRTEVLVYTKYKMNQQQ